MKHFVVISLAGLTATLIAVIPAVDHPLPEETRTPKVLRKPASVVEMANSNPDAASSTGASSRIRSVEPPLEEKVAVGMTASDVVRIHGKHFRSFVGAKVGSMAFFYNDITVSIDEGRVASITVTDQESVDSFLKNVPYEDLLQQSFPWRNPYEDVSTGPGVSAVQTDAGSKPSGFPALQFNLYEFHERGR